jgi:hypothetical protein
VEMARRIETCPADNITTITEPNVARTLYTMVMSEHMTFGVERVEPGAKVVKAVYV